MRKSVLIVAAVIGLASASTAVAGGWATVKLSSSPKGLTALEPWVVDITVLQHGLASQPLCCVKPIVTIRRVAPLRSTSAASKRSLTFRARPTSRTGVYRARILFRARAPGGTTSSTVSLHTAARARIPSQR